MKITTEQGTAVAPNNSVTLDGQESELSLGILEGLGSSAVPLTGQSMTASVGVIDPADQVMGISGVSFSASVGTITPKDQVVGLTGQSFTQ